MLDLYLSFFITWIVVLGPPAFVRLVRRRPLTKTPAIVLCVAFYFANIIFFSAIGSESKSHGALIIGAFFSYYLFQWQTKASTAKAASEQRKELGYDN